MKHAITGLLLTSAVAGCAFTEAHDSALVWRRATVVQVGPADALGPSRALDCRPVAAVADVDAGAVYAIVQYASGRTSIQRIVPVDDGETLAPGDTVEIGRFGCRDAHRPRAVPG